MHADRFRQITLAVVFVATCRVEAESLKAPSAELRITIYDQPLLPTEVLVDSLDALRLILKQAKIRSLPILGNMDDPNASLFMYVASSPNRNEVLGICGARRDIALKIIPVSPPGLPACVLGMASPLADLGVNVRLFDDHIRQAAARHETPYATVLSCAMAHEIGHVLLRSSTHRPSGIMSSTWTQYEYTRMVDGLLQFSAEDARTMEANLRAPFCQSPSATPHRQRTMLVAPPTKR